MKRVTMFIGRCYYIYKFLRENFSHIKKAKKLRLLGISSTLALTLILAVAIFPIMDRMENAEAEAVVSNTAISIAAGRSLASVDIKPVDSIGTFEHTDNTSNISFTVTTDNLTGYSLLLSGNDATGALINHAYSDTLTSISSATDENTFKTGSSATYANKWGIKPDTVNSASNSDYLPAPTTSSSIIINETSTKNTVPDSYEIDLGARVDYIKAAGTYTNTFVLQATSKPVLYEIEYRDTTGDSSVNNLPSDDTGDVTNISAYKLSTGIPTRTGHTFLNWCEGTVTHNNGSNSICVGTTYAAGANYTLVSPSSITKTTVELKAMWKPDTYTINLTNIDATTSGSTSTTATFNSNSLTSITNPQRKYNITGFTLPSGNNANGASVTYSTMASDNCTSASACTNTYSFDGWYTATSSGTRIITSGKALAASTAYTNSSSQWTSTSGATLYAQWTNGTTKLPKITKEGYTCGWTTTSTGATSIQYGSEYTGLHPTAPTTLYGVCTINKYNLTIAFGNSYVTSVSVHSGSTSGTIVKTINSSDSNKTVTGLTYNTTYYLTATYSSTYRYSTSSKTSGSGTLSWPNFTVGAGNATVSVSGKATTFAMAYADAAVSQVSYNSTNYYTMQTMTSTICSAITNGQTANLLDNRVATSSGSTKYTYTVAKIDGGCWMTQNLSFGYNTTSASGGNVDYYDMTLSTTTTNTNSNKTIRFYDYRGAHGTVIASTPGCGANSGSTDGASAASGPGFSTPCVRSGVDNNGARTMWYNYNAATTGLISNPSNSTDASYDLCPAGWRLPKDYATAYKVIPYETLFKPVYGGFVGSGGVLQWETYYGAWWSAKTSNTNTRYYIIKKNESYTVSSDGYRNAGLFIRCIAK